MSITVDLIWCQRIITLLISYNFDNFKFSYRFYLNRPGIEIKYNKLSQMQKGLISESILQNKAGLSQFCQDQSKKVGSWTFHENLLYIIFLDLNKLVMVSKKKRRNTRIFDLMSEYVITRNSLQCRSHHQKLIQKFGEIKTIIHNFKKMVGKEYYREKYVLCKANKEDRMNIGKEIIIAPKMQVAVLEESPVKLEEKLQVPLCPIETSPYQFVPFSSYFLDNPFMNYPFMSSFFSPVHLF